MPVAVGGSNTTYYTDYFYGGNYSGFWLGGYVGGRAGVFCVSSYLVASYYYGSLRRALVLHGALPNKYEAGGGKGRFPSPSVKSFPHN